jgi:hypothetical protein
MKYLVEFKEKATITRLTQCEIEAEDEKEAEEKARKAQAASQNRTSSIPHATGSAAEYQSYAHNLVINTYG